MPGDVVPFRPTISRTTDVIARAIFENTITYVNAFVGQEVWAEVSTEVQDVTDTLFLNGIPVRCNPALAPRRVLVVIGAFIVANFEVPQKAVVPPTPGKEPDEAVVH